jgi:molybdopterin synthase catalytic subunit
MAEVVSGIIDAPLDVGAALARSSDPALGGIAVFVGTVRESASVEGEAGNHVSQLEYEAHPTLAEEKLREVAEEAARKWDVRKVVAFHRTGVCELGEPTVVIVCGAPHRTDALEACRWIIDTVKETVPIWKREIYSEAGDSAWVNTP